MAPYHGGGNLAESLSKSFGYNCDHDNDKNLDCNYTYCEKVYKSGKNAISGRPYIRAALK